MARLAGHSALQSPSSWPVPCMGVSAIADRPIRWRAPIGHLAVVKTASDMKPLDAATIWAWIVVPSRRLTAVAMMANRASSSRPRLWDGVHTVQCTWGKAHGYAEEGCELAGSQFVHFRRGTVLSGRSMTFGRVDVVEGADGPQQGSRIFALQ